MRLPARAFGSGGGALLHAARCPALAMGGRRSRGVRHVVHMRSTTSPRDPSVLQRNVRLEELAERAGALRELLQEIATTAAASGPKGAVRAVGAIEALIGAGREYLLGLRTVQQPPQTVLRRLFERLGATYIKLGQFIASSPTLFPPEYVAEFQKCLDRTDPVPWTAIEKLLDEEAAALGLRVSDIFVRVDKTPLATASVAQVHTAVLRGSNKEVVVKVLKPGVEDILTVDLNFLYLASRVLEFLNPELSRTSLVGIIGDVREAMMAEVDFRKEATHIAQFASYLERAGLVETATCPYVYKDISSRRMLVMERLHGVPLTDLAAIRSITAADPETVLINALNTWFGSLLGCETFHADVHAGNLLVLRDGRIGFIDFGIVGRIAPGTWAAVQALLASIAMRDFETMARALATLGVTRNEVDMQAFASDLEQLFREIEALGPVVSVKAGPGGRTMGGRVELDDTRVNRLLMQIVEVGDANGIRFPREFGILLKQLLYFDRYTRILAPEISVIDDERIDMGKQPQAL